MNKLLVQCLVASILIYKVMAVPTVATELPQDDEDDDMDEDDESSEADDDGRIYKNPRNSPSTECPRDEEQATLLGQKCLRKCSSDEDCKSKRKKCLCDGVCGMSCIKPDRECPELAQPALGQVSVSLRTFGARATYSCSHGYHVVGLQSRLCQADGNWAGAEPACKQNIYCLKPPQIDHARHSALPEQETFDLDSTVQYHCHTGYVTNGFPRAKCLAIDGQASWYGPDIQCEPRSCGQPPDPAYGWHAGECYTFGCKITYNCGTGYELVGKHERYCQSDGSWVPKELPTCVLVTSVVCPTPENPKNGKATYTTLAYNSVVSYECRYGYTLIGESSSRCGADRKWSGILPVCKEINCGHPGVLYNGWIENIEAGTGLGASIIFRCQPEMLINGLGSSVCQIDGRWRNPLPECLAPCIVPTISQGYVIPMEITTDENGTTIAVPTSHPTVMPTGGSGGSVEKVKHGTVLEVKCDTNYEFPVSLLSPPTCNNGTWSIIPRCVPARCKSMPKPPKHGMVLAPKTEHGMKARFKCKDGFKLISPEGKDITDPNDYVLTCSFGNWTGETPQCQEVFCSFPGYIPNGKVLLVGNMGLYDYRPYVKKIVNNKQIMYDCDKGYVLEVGPPGATCVGGKWRPLDLPQCLLGQHPRLRWNRRRRSIQMRYLRSMYLLREQRALRRKYEDYLQAAIHNLNSLDGSGHAAADTSAPKRIKRSPTDLEHAYSKYYQKIKQKYQNYVKNLLGFSRLYNSEYGNPSKSIQVQDSRWHHAHNTPDMLTRSKTIHQSRTLGNDFSNLDYDEHDQLPLSRARAKIPMPNINENSRYSSTQRTTSANDPFGYTNSYNYFVTSLQQQQQQGAAMQRKNATDLIEQLKSQIVRRRRKRNSSQSSLDDDLEHGEVKEEKKRLRGPCEELDWDSFANVTTVRAGKAPGRTSVGIMLHLECNAGFKLNIKGENATARCIRGIWKPETPKCMSAPCLVPNVDNGKYYKVESHTKDLSDKPSLTPLSTYEEIQSNEFITLECEDGYNIQGSAQLRCAHGSWSVNAFSKCISLPCTLPTLQSGVKYEGGYQPGLTIGHGSSVNVHCDHPVNALPIEMTCHKGVITPAVIRCEAGSRKSREEFLTDRDHHEKKAPVVVPPKLEKVVDVEEATNGTDDPLNVTEEAKLCGPPTISDGALVYKNGGKDLEGVYESGTEIYFNCIPSASGERNTWKITCEEGHWIGRSYNCANGTCLFKNNEPNVVSFYNDLEIREDTVEFPPGATIISRCTDIGKFSMQGSNERVCIHSEWTGTKPTCSGLNQENDYAMGKAPTILFRHQNGPIAQSNDGKLIVYPGTTLHMECLWMRRFGNPKWTVSHDYKNYSEGWVTEADEGRDVSLEYRLSIFNAAAEDSGTYSCMTPARHEHSIEIVVKAINCPEIPMRRGLIVNTNDTKLSTRALMSCSNGNSLIGASELFCLPSGNWSAPLPVCESVECGDIPLPNNVSSPRVAVLSREVGGRASFSCSSGYGLRGPSEAICLPTGEWATPFPTCTEVQCDNPGAPQNGYAQGSAPYRAGDIVQFNCNPEYMMGSPGSPIIACQDNGRWSGGLPKCVQACSYPGTAISGRMSSVKFYYAIGESITFTCDTGLELRGAKMLKCMKNGKWSNAIPTCVPMDHH